MAQRSPRKSAREVDARERVRARRAAHWERERRLEDLATDYELAAQEIEDVTEAAEEKIAAYAARLRGQARTAKAGLRDRQARSVGQMLQLDGVRSVADRLGESVETVRKVAAESASTQEDPAPDHSPAPPTATARETPTGQPVTASVTHAGTPHGPTLSEPAEERAASTREEKG
ncbi:hypothetical protein [Streptomyces fulvoviolaceus]|uniref:hypothetical protein n=1 Tax=Streptomyces fulvoviolaceus TaxID=285535 RepID=UPI0021C0F3A4|nr:hypothetical protein [Streptomyces fulvoviolaceus]MCT9075274.1 hypothetical protein [Streptomyces fulvoviolaceus]